MSTVPTGTVTFLFTDIEGSTKLSQQFPAEWDALRARHNSILQQAMQDHDGHVFQIVGDEFCVAFHTALDAIRAAAEAQQMLFTEPWIPAPIKVRMGIHTGTALAGNDTDRSGGYTGYNSLARTARLMSTGHGGQVLVSLATEELIRDELPKGICLHNMGSRRLRDLIHPEQIYQLIIPNLPTDFPPLKTLDAYRHNLPIQLTTFIGRERELTEVRQAIMDHRLVTLTGAGGSGKTRLSLHAAADLLDQFPNGVWFVELASLTNPDLIPQTILSIFGVDDQPGMTTLQLLTDYVRERNLLLVLDNCEHLITEIAKLVTILLTCTENLRILATSREALGVDGELIWYVPSLSLPDIQHLPSIEAFSQYEAVSLFIDRAILAQPHFTVTKDNAPAVAQICYRLDGIPLAIELAAARTKALDVDQINKRLDDRFHLLTGGSRTALPRHQTLRATIDWSYDLLTEQEKVLFRRLAVFSGGWTLEAAEEVCSTEADKLDILDLLPHLVDKSLAVMDNSAGEARYHMHETTRQYANEKLMASGEVVSIRDCHRDWYLKLEETSFRELYGPHELFWSHRFDDEIDNLRAALEWSFGPGESSSKGSEMVSYMAEFMAMKGYETELISWLEKAEKETRGQIRSPTRALILAYYATHNISGYKDSWDDAHRSLEESLEIYNQLGDAYQRERAGALLSLGNILYFKLHEYETGLHYVQEAVRISQEAEDRLQTAFSLRTLAVIKQYEGDFETAITFAYEGAALFRSCENRLDAATCVLRIGNCRMMQEDYQKAKTCFRDALDVFREFGYKAVIVESLRAMGEACRCMDQYAEAEACYRESLTLRQEIGAPLKSFIPDNLNLGYTVLHSGDGLQAVSFFKEALALSWEWEDKEALIQCLAGFAAVFAFRKNAETSVLLYGALDSQVQKFIAEGNRFEVLFEPVDRRELDRYQSLCHSNLGDVEYEAALECGRKMTLEEAINLALEKVGNKE